MIGEYNGAEYYFPYSLGGKTGHSSGAGRCYISFAKKGDLLVAIVTQGVPHQHHYYHFADHRLLLDYVFQKYTENITVEIGSAYKSIGIGEKIQLIPETSEPTNITWHSSDESVAEVNAYGIVTGKKLGQAKITATTETGNVDYMYVSVGFYNGVDIKYSSGPSDPNGPFGYGQLDWSLFKDYGIDFAIIRAGYALDNIPKSDPFFVTNVQGALDNNLNVMVSFDGYATNTTQAKEEARSREFNGNYRIVGSDNDPSCVSLSFANARKAGVSDCVTFKDGDATKMALPAESGILISNPPYGERMMEQSSAQRLYAALGRHLKFANQWKQYFITSEPEFEHYFGRRADKKRKFYNGKIKCDYYMFTDNARRKK